MNTFQKNRKFTITFFLPLLILVFSGCTQRELTIKTVPEGAYVELNDEQVGASPVTVGFNWYGIYRVRLQKEGFKTLKMNKELARPASDYFPLDIFRSILEPGAVDRYEWTFELEEYSTGKREDLITRAEKTQRRTKEQLEKVSAESKDEQQR